MTFIVVAVGVFPFSSRPVLPFGGVETAGTEEGVNMTGGRVLISSEKRRELSSDRGGIVGSEVGAIVTGVGVVVGLC